VLGWLEQSELEDLSFMFAHQEEYVEVKHRVQVLCKEQEEVVLEAKKVLLQTILKDQFLSYMTLDVKVVIVCKELYSIFKKMQETKCSADEIRDIAQLRIILRLKSRAMVGPLCNAQQVCYHVLGLVHAMWPPVPQTVYKATTSFSCSSSVLCREFVLNERNGLGPLEVLMALMPTSVDMSLQMKDYIATPKPNGYQSLHTTLIPFGSKTFFPLEIQVHSDQGLNNFIFIKFHKGR
jgi:GTP pyrophosphokinase